MPDNIINNTTPLPENSGIGTDYSSGTTVEKMTNSISKHNLQIGRKTDARIAKFYDIVYQMVADMSVAEKKNILIEYGATEGITGRSTNHELNAKVTETLITHLENDALENMLRQIKAANASVIKMVNTSLTKRQSAAKNVLRKLDIVDITQVNADGKDANSLAKSLKANYQVDYTGAKEVRGKYPKLRKELQDVLKRCFNNIEIASIAASMKLEYEADDSRKDLSDKIIDRVVLYVHLLTSNSKKAPFKFTIADPEPYNNLLKMTSYAYMSGEPGLPEGEWSVLKNKARRAKVLMKEREKQHKRRLSAKEKEFTEVAGHYNTKNIAKELNTQDNGILANASYDKLVELAGKYGIDPTKKTLGKLKYEIYQAMAADLRDTRKIQAKANKQKRGGLFGLQGLNRSLEDQLAVRGDILNQVNGLGTSTTNPMGVPTITIDEKGNVPPTESISKAVPVVIVGEKNAADINKANEDIRKVNKVGALLKGKRKAGTDYDNIKSSLPDEDATLLFQFMSLKTLADPKDPEASGPDALKTFIGVRNYLSVFVKDNVLDAICRNLTTNSDGTTPEGSNLGIAYCWYYAIINGRTKLSSYIDKYFGDLIPSKLRRNVFKKERAKDISRHKLKVFKAQKKGKQGPKDLLTATDNPPAPPTGTDISLRAFKVQETNNTDNSLPWGSDGQNRAKFGTRNRDIALKMYGDKFGIGYIDSKSYLIKLKDPSDKSSAEEADKAVGRKLTKNRFPKDGYYRPTKATIKWALDNNRQFAQGGSGSGSAFIAGDSLNGEENPELVKIHKNGAFSVTPLNQTPSNGNVSNEQKKNDTKLRQYISKAGEDLLPLDKLKLNKGVQAVYSINKENDRLASVLSNINNEIYSMSSWIQERLPSYFMAFGNEVVTAPMGVGTITRPLIYTTYIQDAINLVSRKLTSATDAAINNLGTKMATGGTISKSSGTTAITGDAAGNNIFANGAQPELVQSSGDMKITPLNQVSNNSTKQKVQRMTTAERNSALAVGISSHIVKAKYTLDSGVSEVSNTGEAIKVYSIKPGITDKIDINGSQYSLMDLMIMINTQLSAITQNSTVGNTLLEGILKSNSTVAANTTPTSSSSGNPFLGDFPSSLDNILQGG